MCNLTDHVPKPLEDRYEELLDNLNNAAIHGVPPTTETLRLLEELHNDVTQMMVHIGDVLENLNKETDARDKSVQEFVD